MKLMVLGGNSLESEARILSPEEGFGGNGADLGGEV